jgi:hypothetical protein
MTTLSGTISIDANGNVTGRLTEAGTVPTPSPAPLVPPTPPTPPTPPAAGTKTDRTKANLLELMREGPRGRVLAWQYFQIGNGYLYKSPLQNWLAAMLPQFGTDYAHWTDPTSFAGEFWSGGNMTANEITRLRAMQAFANQGS